MEVVTPEMGLLIWTVIMLVTIGLPVIALINLVRSSFKDSTTKLVWVIIIVFMPFIGSILYFLIGRNQRVDAV